MAGPKLGDHNVAYITGGVTVSALTDLYRQRFSDEEKSAKSAVWQVLCADFFGKYIRSDDRVLDVAAGFCEFSNHIRAAEVWAVDMNPDMPRFAGPNVNVILGSCTEMPGVPRGYFHVAFASNFFEHLPSKDALDEVLQAVRSCLRPGGRLLILQPNIRYLGGRYWDFYDHLLPLTHLSLSEGLRQNGYVVDRVFPRFLPYTFKSALPRSPLLVRAYLRFPPAWRVLGRQSFLVASRRP